MTNTELRNKMRSSFKRQPNKVFYSSHQWKEVLRPVVLKRDGYRCKCCRKGGLDITVHHIIPRDKKGGDNEENLISLCSSCHDQVELGTITIEEARNGALAPNKEITKGKIQMYRLSPDWSTLIYLGDRDE